MSKLVRYPPAKLRQAFAMLIAQGRLDEVERRLTDQGFEVLLSEEHAHLIAAELAAADDEKTLKGSSDCPC